jgi:hypothetical protein
MSRRSKEPSLLEAFVGLFGIIGFCVLIIIGLVVLWIILSLFLALGGIIAFIKTNIWWILGVILVGLVVGLGIIAVVGGSIVTFILGLFARWKKFQDEERVRREEERIKNEIEQKRKQEQTMAEVEMEMSIILKQVLDAKKDFIEKFNEEQKTFKLGGWKEEIKMRVMNGESEESIVRSMISREGGKVNVDLGESTAIVDEALEALDGFEQDTGGRKFEGERELQSALYYWLRKALPNRVIDFEIRGDYGKPDFVIDKVAAVEVKIADGMAGLNNLIGEVNHRKKEYQEVGAIILDSDEMNEDMIYSVKADLEKNGVKVRIIKGRH